jgi:hypothetical protein
MPQGAYGTNYDTGGHAGGYRSTGMPEGQFSYGNVEHRYEDVRGVPPVERGYATGMMSTSTAPESMSDDMGTGLMAEHSDGGETYGS